MHTKKKNEIRMQIFAWKRENEFHKDLRTKCSIVQS